MGFLGLFVDLVLGTSDKKADDLWVEEESWFEHSGEEHDIEDGYCMECDCEIEDCEE